MKKTSGIKSIIFVFLFLSANTFTFAQKFYDGKSLPPVLSGQKFLTESRPASGFSLSNLNTVASPSSTMINSPDPEIKIYSGLGDNIVNSFKGDNLYLHLAGIASTLLLVTTSSDYYVHKYFNEHEQYGQYASPVIHYATYFPFVISGSLYAYGKLNTDNEAVGASFAVLQSTVLAFLYNSLLKAVTGRPNPDWRHNSDMDDLSKTFRFGFLRGGIFWGWPSGHTSSTMAVVSALTSFYPEKTWLKVVGYSYVAYMMFAVSSLNRGGMHWFSDAVAAAFMSYAIGSTVGKFYRSRFTNDASSQIIPASPMQSLPGLSFTIYF